MSHLLDRLNFLAKKNVGTFSEGHGVTTNENRDWEDSYRKRWQHDKIVRSTHGANCTGSCSWKIYVKGGIVTWETQQTDYPRTRPDLPNHEPRGCSRGASYSWYMYSANRVKYPLIRSRLLKLWRKERVIKTPVAAWEAIQADPAKRGDYTKLRGHGGFVRATWDEVNEIIAAANAYTARKYGPDRVIGFSPIPAMSMVSYAAGSRYLSLLGGTCMSFYDWYCDLPPASPMTWGEQTDVPESADWYNSGFLMLWGSNVPQTRTPDAHFYTEVRYKGTKIGGRFAGLFRGRQIRRSVAASQAGHRCRPCHGDGACDPARIPSRPAGGVFRGLLPPLYRHADAGPAGREGRRTMCRSGCSARRILRARFGETNNPEWKTVAVDAATGKIVVPNGSVGFRWGETGKWNLEAKEAGGADVKLDMTFILDDRYDQLAEVAFPYFGNREHDYFEGTDHPSVLVRTVPARKVQLADGEALVATVFDLFVANYGLDRGFGGMPHPPSPTTTTCPTLRPGRRKSPACRVRRSSRWPANSPATPRRLVAAPWSSSAPA